MEERVKEEEKERKNKKRERGEKLRKGPYLNDVYKIFGILHPSPHASTLTKFIVLNPRNLPYYVST